MLDVTVRATMTNLWSRIQQTETIYIATRGKHVLEFAREHPDCKELWFLAYCQMRAEIYRQLGSRTAQQESETASIQAQIDKMRLPAGIGGKSALANLCFIIETLTDLHGQLERAAARPDIAIFMSQLELIIERTDMDNRASGKQTTLLQDYRREKLRIRQQMSTGRDMSDIEIARKAANNLRELEEINTDGGAGLHVKNTRGSMSQDTRGGMQTTPDKGNDKRFSSNISNRSTSPGSQRGSYNTMNSKSQQYQNTGPPKDQRYHSQTLQNTSYQYGPSITEHGNPQGNKQMGSMGNNSGRSVSVSESRQSDQTSGDVRQVTRNTMAMGIDERETNVSKMKEDQEAQQWDQYRMNQGKYRAIIRYATTNSEEITRQAKDSSECIYCGSERHKGVECNLTWIIRDTRGQETPLLSVYKMGQIKYLTPEGYEAQLAKAREKGLLKGLSEDEYNGFCRMVDERETAIRERDMQMRPTGSYQSYQGRGSPGRYRGRGNNQGRGYGGRGGSNYSAYNPNYGVQGNI
jgi:hypothetical protein